MKVIDGGYISWCYGSSPERISSWSSFFFADTVFVMDKGRPLRNTYYEDYKKKRKDAREEDPKKQEIYNRVRAFQDEKIWAVDGKELCVLSYEGLEADDLVALLAWKYRGVDLLGIDKDLLQLGPTLRSLKRLDESEVTLIDWIRKLPKGIQHGVKWSHRLVPLVLALMGDKSDSIPRLVPNYQLETLRQVLAHPYPFQTAVNTYGSNVLRNIYISTLPGPFLFGLTPEQTIDMLDHRLWRPEEGLLERLDPSIEIQVLSKGDQYHERRNYHQRGAADGSTKGGGSLEVATAQELGRRPEADSTALSPESGSDGDGSGIHRASGDSSGSGADRLHSYRPDSGWEW